MLGRKDTSNLKEATVAPCYMKHYKVISKQFEAHYSVESEKKQVENIQDSCQCCRSGCPSKLIVRSDSLTLRDIAKFPRAISQTLLVSVSSLNVKSHDSTIRKRLKVRG